MAITITGYSISQLLYFSANGRIELPAPVAVHRNSKATSIMSPHRAPTLSHPVIQGDFWLGRHRSVGSRGRPALSTQPGGRASNPVLVLVCWAKTAVVMGDSWWCWSMVRLLQSSQKVNHCCSRIHRRRQPLEDLWVAPRVGPMPRISQHASLHKMHPPNGENHKIQTPQSADIHARRQLRGPCGTIPLDTCCFCGLCRAPCDRCSGETASKACHFQADDRPGTWVVARNWKSQKSTLIVSGHWFDPFGTSRPVPSCSSFGTIMRMRRLSGALFDIER